MSNGQDGKLFPLWSLVLPHLCRSSLRCIPAHRRSALRPLSPRNGHANTAERGTNPLAPPAGYTRHQDIPPRSRSGTYARPAPRTRPSHTWFKMQWARWREETQHEERPNIEKNLCTCHINTFVHVLICQNKPHSLAAFTRVDTCCHGDNICWSKTSCYWLVTVLPWPPCLAVTMGTLWKTACSLLHLIHYL